MTEDINQEGTEKYPSFKTVSEYFRYTCERIPYRKAQVFNPDLYGGDNRGEFTWEEMRQRVDAIAGGMLKLEMERQERVGLMSHSSPYWTHVDMALSNAAGVSVTIYPTLSAREVAYIVDDSSLRFLFVGSAETAEMIIENIQLMPGLKKIIVMDLFHVPSHEKVMSMKQLMDEGSEWLKNNTDQYEKRWKSLTEDDWYTILYTSGTTGQGKGVILPHWSAVSRIEGVRNFFGKCGMYVDDSDVTLCFLPLSHIFDRGSCQLLALAQGSLISYADKPGTLLADMQKYNPTWINCVPRLYEKIYITFQQQIAASPVKKRLFDWAMKVGLRALEYRKDENGCYNMSPDFDLKSRLPFGLRLQFKIADRLFAKVRALFGNRFRYSFSASAGISPDLLKFFYAMGFAVVEGYGSTESCNACILNPITACKPGFMGIDANGSASRIAEDGELEISGAGIFKGYLNKPEENEEAFTEDGWFKTGDLVIKDDQGYIKMVDRKKAIICTAVGKNIAPAKLENQFATSSYIEQVFLVGDERNYITALLVPNFNYFVERYREENIPFDEQALVWSDAPGADICMSVGNNFVETQFLKDLVATEVEKANENLEGFEKIKNYTILTSRFSEENGQLTPTQKAKKRVILEVYGDKIDAMYA